MEPFKNFLNLSAAQKISQALQSADKSFRHKIFLNDLAAELEPLELKQRMLVLTDRLKKSLPAEPQKSFPILVAALKSDAQPNGLSGFLVWPLTEFVAQEGLSHFDLSMNALGEMTKVFTAEFAVRSFFIHHQEKTLNLFTQWSNHPNEHIRRLVSEGSRPYLPWGQKLTTFANDPEITWGLLEKLKNDSSKYVQKSVANHINDHSKKHADWVIKKLNKWKSSKHESVHWIITHGTRTLIKKGHTGALALQGVKPGNVKILKTKILTPKVKLGGALEVEITLKNASSKECKVIFDNEVQFLKSKGHHTPKVFKGKNFILKPQEGVVLRQKIPLREITTRTYHFGDQYWLPIINGTKGSKKKFTLVK